ncbi:DUF2993 domain-containing protein [Pannus brasiliensis CCIBt3594]|uniref:DUF2993 domain-containing protein n=1 Tax=Pannus brasiliensis CCIBt3594 TaxID=1427578 RepID=A0AAW9QZ44_9CHRO
MEWFTIALSSLLTLLVPAGAILDSVLANSIRARVNKVEQLSVRVDNTPSYQALQGKVDRVRVAGRGLYPVEGFRVEAIDLETDPLSVDIGKLQQKKAKLNEALRKPASGALRLVLTEEDINKALQSPEIKARVQAVIDRAVPRREETGNQSFQLQSARVDFLENNRVATTIEVRSIRDGQVSEPIDLALEVGLKVIDGRKLELLDPSGTLNGRRLSGRILRGFADGIAERLDANALAKEGIFARLLQFQIDGDKLQVAVFARLDPRSGNTSQR